MCFSDHRLKPDPSEAPTSQYGSFIPLANKSKFIKSCLKKTSSIYPRIELYNLEDHVSNCLKALIKRPLIKNFFHENTIHFLREEIEKIKTKEDFQGNTPKMTVMVVKEIVKNVIRQVFPDFNYEEDEEILFVPHDNKLNLSKRYLELLENHSSDTAVIFKLLSYKECIDAVCVSDKVQLHFLVQMIDIIEGYINKFKPYMSSFNFIKCAKRVSNKKIESEVVSALLIINEKIVDINEGNKRIYEGIKNRVYLFPSINVEGTWKNKLKSLIKIQEEFKAELGRLGRAYPDQYKVVLDKEFFEIIRFDHSRFVLKLLLQEVEKISINSMVTFKVTPNSDKAKSNVEVPFNDSIVSSKPSPLETNFRIRNYGKLQTNKNEFEMYNFCKVEQKVLEGEVIVPPEEWCGFEIRNQ